MTEEEARAILAEVEPPLAAYEREQSRLLRSEELGDMIPRVRVQHAAVEYADWRPRATRTRSGWTISGGWLDEPVPPLPTRGVPNAGGVAILLPLPWLDEGGESMRDRHPTALFTNITRDGFDLGALTLIDFLRPDPARWGYAPSDLVIARMRAAAWHNRRFEVRAVGTPFAARGWCTMLGAPRAATRPGTLAGWQYMRRVCAKVMRETDAAWAAERAELTQRTEAA